MPDHRITPPPHPVTGCLLTLGIAAVCCAIRWLADPLVEGKLWVLPAAVTTVLAARWFGPGPAAVGLVTTTLAGEFLFVRPRAEWTTMLVRDAIPLLISLAGGALVIWTIWELRTRAVILDREVSLRRQAEFELGVSRTRFEQFLDSAPFAAYLKDADGRFVFINRHLRATYPEVVVGRTVHELFPAEQADDYTRNDDWVRRTGEPFQCEEVAVGSDGITRHWSTFKFPATADDGRRGLGGVSIEITDRKRADDLATRSESLLRRLIEVQELEKRSLCHELHDGLLQYSIAAGMMLEGWRHEHPGADAAAIDDAIRWIAKGIDDGRRTLRGIRPETLDDLGLKTAIEEYAAGLAGPDLDVNVSIADEIDGIPAPTQTMAFRIVQEACSNARRHSGTDRIRVAAWMDGDSLEIRVDDFGRGFDAASPPQTGFGLTSMVERARLCGGSCRIESVAGRGTVVRASLRL